MLTQGSTQYIFGHLYTNTRLPVQGEDVLPRSPVDPQQ